MTAWLDGVSWSWPGAWMLLALVPALVLLRWWVERSAAVPFAPVQYAGRPGRSRRWLALQLLLEAALFTSLVVAAAGPHERREVPLIGPEGVDLALVLDVSATMQAADFPPTRLEALKVLASDLVRRGGGHRFAVFAFAQQPFTQTPLTTDTVATNWLIDGLAYESINHSVSGGTWIGDALLAAGQALVAERVEGRDQAVLLVTDGQSNGGIAPEIAARWLAERDVDLFVVGIGQDEPVPVYVHGEPFINTDDEHVHTQLDDAALQSIADAGGGRYWRADGTDPLRAIFDEVATLAQRPLTEEVAVSRISHRPDVALGTLALFAAWLLLSGFVLRRPLR